jgi:hypothetical protein
MLKLLPTLLFGLPCLALAQTTMNPPSPPALDAASQVPVLFTGGYETDPQDRGRPVVLIAAALKVPPEVFRQAFRHVRPAPAGQQPEPDQVRRNKQALLSALGPYGVTNDRLDEVSNYYRYNGRNGELWRHTEATAYATVRDGVVQGITITNPGSGYSSVPTLSLPGLGQVSLQATLSYGPDLQKNGAIQAITVERAP